MKMIDLSVNLEKNSGEPVDVKIVRTGHQEGADSIGRRLVWSKRRSFRGNVRSLIHYLSGQRRLDRHSFPDEEFLSLEIVTLSSHAGTHMDAPEHFGTMSEGRRARTIDELPLEWFYGDGVILDMTHKRAGEFITLRDVVESLEKLDYKLKPLDIVLIHTGTDKKWGTPAYFHDAPGMSREATEYLIDQGIKVMGIDCYGFDRPFPHMIEDYFATGNSEFLWPAHVLGRHREYVHMERLCNLDQVPHPFHFKVSCFPVKLTGSGASWIRAVAMVQD